MTKNLRELIRDLRRAGATVEQGSNHYKVKWGGHLVVVLSSTAGDRGRAHKNNIAAIRRAGIPIPRTWR